jgi:hypothetical protein
VKANLGVTNLLKNKGLSSRQGQWRYLIRIFRSDGSYGFSRIRLTARRAEAKETTNTDYR